MTSNTKPHAFHPALSTLLQAERCQDCSPTGRGHSRCYGRLHLGLFACLLCGLSTTNFWILRHLLGADSEELRKVRRLTSWVGGSVVALLHCLGGLQAKEHPLLKQRRQRITETEDGSFLISRMQESHALCPQPANPCTLGKQQKCEIGEGLPVPGSEMFRGLFKDPRRSFCIHVVKSLGPLYCSPWHLICRSFGGTCRNSKRYVMRMLFDTRTSTPQLGTVASREGMRVWP